MESELGRTKLACKNSPDNELLFDLSESPPDHLRSGPAWWVLSLSRDESARCVSILHAPLDVKVPQAESELDLLKTLRSYSWRSGRSFSIGSPLEAHYPSALSMSSMPNIEFFALIWFPVRKSNWNRIGIQI